MTAPPAATVKTADLPRPAARKNIAPEAPRSLADAGLTVDQLEQLLVKMLFTGEATGQTLADRTCLPYGILEPVFERLRAERQVEVRGGAGTGTVMYRYALTDLGDRKSVV